MSRSIDNGSRIGVVVPEGPRNGTSVHTGRTPDGSLGQNPAAIYAKKWDNASASGRGLYVGNSGESGTPLLDSMISHLPSSGRNGRKLTVVEAAAGGGEQALHLATQLDHTNVVAIDTSPHATARIRERVEANRDVIKTGSEITVVTGDVLAVLADRDPGSVDAFHANSFWHFLSQDERDAQVATLHEVQRPGGLVAVSFKAGGDGLLSEPGTTTVGDSAEGIHAVPADGIRRLFVTDPGEVAASFERRGLEVIDTMEYVIPDYDIPGKDGKFVGVLAKVPA